MTLNQASGSEYYLIEHPGIIRNIDNAIATLGGNEAIQEVITITSPYKYSIFSHSKVQRHWNYAIIPITCIKRAL